MNKIGKIFYQGVGLLQQRFLLFALLHLTAVVRTELLAEEVFPPVCGEFEQALSSIPSTDIANIRSKCGDNQDILMGGAILAEGQLSVSIRQECVRKFADTEKVFLGHDLANIDITKEENYTRIHSHADRLLKIDSHNGLGHCYKAAAAALSNGEKNFHQHTMLLMEKEHFTAYSDRYLNAHFCALDKLGYRFGPVRKHYMIRGMQISYLTAHSIVLQQWRKECERLIKNGDVEGAIKKYEMAVTIADKILLAKPRLLLTEHYHANARITILTRIAELHSSLGNVTAANVARQTAQTYRSYSHWMKELVVRKMPSHRLGTCSHWNAEDLQYLNSFAEMFCHQGEVAAYKAAPDLRWLIVDGNRLSEWKWKIFPEQ